MCGVWESLLGLLQAGLLSACHQVTVMHLLVSLSDPGRNHTSDQKRKEENNWDTIGA